MENQISMFEMLEMDETPKLPPEMQKKGKTGWVIQISGIFRKKYNWQEDMVGVCTRPVKFEKDSQIRNEEVKQYARYTHGPPGGWYGAYETIYAKRPSWEECVAYARDRYTKGEKIVYYEQDGNCHGIWGYENGYKKGGETWKH